VEPLSQPEPSETEVVAVAWRIQGRVQGVAFRWFTCQAARDLGIDGWVRNLPDGSVEARARGRRQDLRQLERQLRRGPQAAEVRAFEEESLDPCTPLGEGFEIRY
jgi:acylphosphatase